LNAAAHVNLIRISRIQVPDSVLVAVLADKVKAALLDVFQMNHLRLAIRDRVAGSLKLGGVGGSNKIDDLSAGDRSRRLSDSST
jgi:hypothetical protein